MALSASNTSIFVGAAARPVQKYLSVLFKKFHDIGGRTKLVVPCAGKFGVVEVAIAAGWEPQRIISSDICLFSTLIGYLVSGEGLDSLDIHPSSEAPDEIAKILLDAQSTGDQWEIAASTMLLLKIGQLNPGVFYEAQFIRELVTSSKEQVSGILEDLKLLVEKLEGVEYYARGVREEISKCSNDPEALLVIDLPVGVYSKTERLVDWNHPDAVDFDTRKDRAGLWEGLKDSNALALMWQRAGRDGKGIDVSQIVYGVEKKTDYLFLVSNKPSEVTALVPQYITPRKMTEVVPGPYVLFDDGDDITPKSVVTVKYIKREEALYYRDLFAHKLGATDAEIFLGMFVDGKLFGVLGLHTRSLRCRQSEWIYEVFGFCVGSRKYKRIGKLLMMCLVTEEFRDVVYSLWPDLINLEPVGIQTTCLSPYPEVKSDRGVLKLVMREKQEDGRFKLQYQQTWKPMRFKDALKTWCEKHSGVKA